MEKKDMPAFPVLEAKQLGDKMVLDLVSPWLTKRELIASQMDARSDIADFSLEYLEALIGRARPSAPTTAEELLKWDAECEAKIKVIKADALIAELSKPQP